MQVLGEADRRVLRSRVRVGDELVLCDSVPGSLALPQGHPDGDVDELDIAAGGVFQPTIRCEKQSTTNAT
ncbi:hypothetical protein GCM10009551_079020 [Nocardiopsis tropica]